MTENTSAMHLDHDLGFLRPMTEVDLELVLAWRNHPSIRAHMYAQHEITKDEHRAWWTRVASSPTAAFFIYERLGVPLGYVSFSEIESKNAQELDGERCKQVGHPQVELTCDPCDNLARSDN